MRSIFVIWLTLIGCLDLAQAGYSFSRSLTIDKTKVPNTDQTDFPVLVCFNGAAAPCNDGSLTIAALKTVGNGGSVTNSSGFDIVFASNPSCTSLLNWEMEFYSATTGEVDAWVKIPSVSTSVNTVFYMCYANAAISTFQGNVTGTWNSDYLMVAHYPNGTSLTVLDSTSNAFNGSVVGGVAAGAGQIDGAAVPNGTTGYIDSAGFSSATSNGTFEAWVNLTGLNGVIISSPGNSGPYMYVDTLGNIQCACAPLNNPAVSVSTVATTTWTQLVCTFSLVPAENKIYKDGAITTLSLPGGTGGMLNPMTGIRVGAWQNATLFTNGTIDEIRISGVVRSADWIATEYNNQFSPATFYTVGAQTQLGGGKLLLLGVG